VTWKNREVSPTGAKVSPTGAKVGPTGPTERSDWLRGRQSNSPGKNHIFCLAMVSPDKPTSRNENSRRYIRQVTGKPRPFARARGQRRRTPLFFFRRRGRTSRRSVGAAMGRLLSPKNRLSYKLLISLYIPGFFHHSRLKDLTRARGLGKRQVGILNSRGFFYNRLNRPRARWRGWKT
jgi:hypothetical protein